MSASDQPRFSNERLAEIDAVIKRYPSAKSALMPALHMAQQDFGYLSMGTQQMVADVLGLKIMEVREVVTFYTMFKEQPHGKYLLEVCTNASCMLNGADALYQHMKDTLGLEPGQISEDGLFSIAEVECAGACAGAPVVQVNNMYYEKATVESMDALITKVRAGEAI